MRLQGEIVGLNFPIFTLKMDFDNLSLVVISPPSHRVPLIII